MVDPKDSSSISIPFALLASKDESAEACEGFVAGLKGEKHFQTFHDMPHVGRPPLFHLLVPFVEIVDAVSRVGWLPVEISVTRLLKSSISAATR